MIRYQTTPRFHRTAADMAYVRDAQGYTTPQVRQHRRRVVAVRRCFLDLGAHGRVPFLVKA